MKSNVSDFLELFEAVYIDASNKCTADVLDLRDLQTCRSRVEAEGLSFLTISLPRFCNDFEQALESGQIVPASFAGFHRTKNGAIPELFQGMLGQIFNHRTGELIYYDKNNVIDGDFSSDIPTLIESVRQICLTFKKVELECTPKRVQAALENFVKIETELSSFKLQEHEYSKFLEICALLWGTVLYGIRLQDCTPRHGPGATAEHISGNKKYVWRKWYDRLEPYFPIIDNGYPLGTEVDGQELKNVSIIPIGQEDPVRVIHVPKTLKAPRIIAIEPCCMQYIQQGIRDVLYRAIEGHSLTKGHVNFRDQSVNQKIALTSSSDGRSATIDLSDASDRVPRSLALDMFRSNPDLMDAIDACRSTHANIGEGRIIGPLSKFASMGSALCFPVEAMYFYTICVMALLDDNGLSYTARNVRKVTRGVYVYGDDIVVPSTNAVSVLAYLQKYNCKVNTKKTFLNGKFRESCGTDAYAGYEVTPTYLRHERPLDRQQASQTISWCSTANLFYKRGYWRTASLMFNKLESVVGSLPYVAETSEALGRFSYLGYETAERWNRKLQRFEVKAYVPRPVYRTDRLEGYAALTKCLLKLGNRISTASPFPLLEEAPAYPKSEFSLGEVSDVHHLEQSALHGAVTLKRRWAPTH
jgi:hypothetical protein